MSVVDLDPNRTIVAIASALGPAMRGIVRLSGPQTLVCLNRLCNPEIAAPQSARWFATHLRLAGIKSPVSANILLWPDSRSYTRQQSAEIHLIGSLPVVEALVDSLCQNGAALACPGEFTLRAFLAGRLDLSQAEAILGAVDASSEADFAIALAQNAGGLRQPLERIRQELLELLAHLEAGLDFVEDDIQFIARTDLESALDRIQSAIGEINRQLSARSVSKDGWRVTLIGRPNAGKSSLFNAILGRPAAIATEIAGTTRDYLVEATSIGGFGVQLADTAGFNPKDLSQASGLERASGCCSGTRQSFDPNSGEFGYVDRHCDMKSALGPQSDSIQDLAQLQTRNRIAQSHLELLCVERGLELDDWERRRLREGDEQLLCVATKSDLRCEPTSWKGIPVSARTGHGLEELKLKIAQQLALLSEHPGACLPTATRCTESLLLASAALHRATQGLRESAGDEIIAAELRAALDELGCIVGAVYTDDILDRIFSRFCIGK